MHYQFTVGVKDLGKMAKERARTLRKALFYEFDHAAHDMLLDLRTRTGFVKKVDLGLLKAGWRAKKRAGGLSYEFTNVAPYHMYVEFGRKPGKWPPISKISAWCGRKLGDPTLGFVVARKIGTEGIAACPIITSEGSKKFARTRFAAAVDRAEKKNVEVAISFAKAA